MEFSILYLFSVCLHLLNQIKCLSVDTKEVWLNTWSDEGAKRYMFVTYHFLNLILLIQKAFHSSGVPKWPFDVTDLSPICYTLEVMTVIVNNDLLLFFSYVRAQDLCAGSHLEHQQLRSVGVSDFEHAFIFLCFILASHPVGLQRFVDFVDKNR